jgi:hypothetical protein
MDRNEKGLDRKEVIELLERAETLGVRLEFDSGLNLANLAAGDLDRQLDIIAEICQLHYFGEIRRILERRAAVARVKQFIGRPIWFPGYGEGVLRDASSTGLLELSMKNLSPASSHVAMLQADARKILLIIT